MGRSSGGPNPPPPPPLPSGLDPLVGFVRALLPTRASRPACLEREAQLRVEKANVVARAGLVYQISREEVAVAGEHIGVPIHRPENRQVEFSPDVTFATVPRTNDAASCVVQRIIGVGQPEEVQVGADSYRLRDRPCPCRGAQVNDVLASNRVDVAEESVA